MDKRVLIVHPNSDMILTILGLLKKEIKSQGYRLSEDWATTAMEAEQSFLAAELVDLVITAVEIPSTEPGDRNDSCLCRRGGQ